MPTAEELGSDWDATICQVTTDYRTSCCQVGPPVALPPVHNTHQHCLQYQPMMNALYPTVACHQRHLCALHVIGRCTSQSARDQCRSPSYVSKLCILKARLSPFQTRYSLSNLKGSAHAVQVARRDGNLMRVGVDEVTALVVLCAGGAAGEQAARDHIEAVDPPSVGVPLDDPLLRLQLAIGLKGAAVHFCLNTQVHSCPV